MNRVGFIYVLISSAHVDLVKIGKSTRGAHQRAEELSKGTGVPAQFQVALELKVNNCDEAECRVHEALAPTKGMQMELLR